MATHTTHLLDFKAEIQYKKFNKLYIYTYTQNILLPSVNEREKSHKIIFVLVILLSLLHYPNLKFNW